MTEGAAGSGRRIVVTGASGLIGTALVEALRRSGDDVLRLVRRTPKAPDEARWDPAQHDLDPALLRDADVVVNLAGAAVGPRRWTDSYRRTIAASRVDSTLTISRALAEAARGDDRPRVLVSASGSNFYGDTGERTVDETGPQGDQFLSGVCAAWEAATRPAADAGVRVVLLRSGIVLDATAPILKILSLPFRLGLGGRAGSGRQWWSWISLADEVSAIRFLLDQPDIAGPVNLVSPQPVRNADFTRTLAKVLHRPAPLLVPGVALTLAMPGFADEAVLSSQRLEPAVLEQAGYRYRHPDLDGALRAALG